MSATSIAAALSPSRNEWGIGANACLEKATDEFGLTVGARFDENAVGMSARRRTGDVEPLGSGLKPVSANDFPKNAGLRGG